MLDTLSPVFRQVPVGAEVQANGSGTHFRVWAPQHRSVEVVFEQGRAGALLADEENGYFSGFVANVSAGTRYKYGLDGGEAYPDPASRYQPTGPHGWSEIVDPRSFRWSDDSLAWSSNWKAR